MNRINEILEGCKQNNRQCQEELYRQIYPAMFALCKQFFDDNHDALTALNNGMLRVYKNVGLYDPARGEFFNWAYTIIRNEALSLIKDKKQQAFIELQEDAEVISGGNPFKSLEWKDVYVYLGKLPPVTRAVCSLFYIQGFSVKETASSLSIKEGTVKWHLNECRNKLKRIFEKSCQL